MILPHQEPLIFAKKIIEQNKEFNIVKCEFNHIPTLATFIEAAAQASISFIKDNDTAKIGFLTVAKNINKLESITKTTYLFKLENTAELNSMKQFYFESLEEDTKKVVVNGNFTVVLQE
ncbi:MAG: hypothetical protein U9R16_08510 [Campylobacterota bacterium]|nr:hypothetical protein [Campylobacterota bacterium]